jgi:hypothetical protein
MQGMQMDGGNARLLDPVTERITGCALRIANTLGHGFVESIAGPGSGTPGYVVVTSPERAFADRKSRL